MNDYSTTIAPAERPRDYAGLLWIFAAGILGFGMFCATSAVALSDSSLDEPIAVAPGDLVNRAFSDLNTAAALTAQAFAEYIPTITATPTATATFTQTASPTLTSSPTATRIIIIVSPTSTRRPSQPTAVPQRPTNTPIRVEPNTPTPQLPTPTNQPPETPTETPDFNPPPEPSLPPPTSGTP